MYRYACVSSIRKLIAKASSFKKGISIMMISDDTRVTVIGCGRWGSFLSWYLSGLGFKIMMYGRADSDSYQALRTSRKNEYLDIPDSVEFTDDIKYALSYSNTIVISVGVQSFPALAREIRDTLGENDGKTYILCMKGIIEDGGLRPSEALYSALGPDTKCVLWLGPGHAEDFVKGIPNCMLLASSDAALAKAMCDRLGSSLIRFYYSADVIGCEVGAATKNVIGIGAGILDGMNYSSLKGALMARGPREIARLAEAMGGNERSIFGLCHLGDYEATLFSQHSHNRRFGESFVRHEPYGKLAEGVFTVRSLMYLKNKYNIEMPICTAVNDVIHEGKDPEDVMASLFLREQKSEF